jgi:hypothetical protein
MIRLMLRPMFRLDPVGFGSVRSAKSLAAAA